MTDKEKAQLPGPVDIFVSEFAASYRESGIGTSASASGGGGASASGGGGGGGASASGDEDDDDEDADDYGDDDDDDDDDDDSDEGEDFVKLVIRAVTSEDWSVKGYLLTYYNHKFALEPFSHCSCDGTEIPERNTHTLSYKDLVYYAKHKIDINPSLYYGDKISPDLLEIYRQILETENKRELLYDSKKMREPW